MKRLGFFLIICISLSLSSCRFFEKRGWFGTKESDTMEVWQARQDSIRVADSIMQVKQREQQAIEQARADSLQRVEQERLAYEARFRYHIVVGSFITPEYARDFREYFQNMGYEATIVPKPDSRFEFVSAEVHDNLSEAIRRVRQFQDTVVVDAWIYIRQ